MFVFFAAFLKYVALERFISMSSLGKPSKEKTGNILVFYQSGVPPPPPFSEDW